MKNEGKIFEQSFQDSINKEDILVKRLNDNAASFGDGTNTRFASTNECDYILFHSKYKILYCLELKSTLSSLTYWREDFKGKSFNIKKNQILGLEKFSKYDSTVCGLLINFRSTENNNTYFIHINDFLKYTKYLDKKSIGEKDVLKMNPIMINSAKKRTRYTYDLEKFFKETKEI